MDKIKNSVLKILFLFAAVLFIIYFLDKDSNFQDKVEDTYLIIGSEEINFNFNDEIVIEKNIKAAKDIKDISDSEQTNDKIVIDEEHLNEEIIDEKNNPNMEKNILNEQDEVKKDIVSRGKETIETTRLNNIDNKYLNNYVLDVVNSYNGGNYPYLLNNDYQNYNGVTEDIYYNGELILKSHPSGKKYSHCTGITFEVFFKAMQKRNRDNGISADSFNNMNSNDFRNFMLLWYVAMAPKSESNLAIALEKYGIGKRIIDLEEVRAGDFIDFSRENNTGHSVVFINWIRENNKIIGLKYWSSQDSTKGIAYKEEFFNIRDFNGNKYGGIIMDDLHIGRVYPINDYKNISK